MPAKKKLLPAPCPKCGSNHGTVRFIRSHKRRIVLCQIVHYSSALYAAEERIRRKIYGERPRKPSKMTKEEWAVEMKKWKKEKMEKELLRRFRDRCETTGEKFKITNGKITHTFELDGDRLPRFMIVKKYPKYDSLRLTGWGIAQIKQQGWYSIYGRKSANYRWRNRMICKPVFLRKAVKLGEGMITQSISKPSLDGCSK